MKLYCAGQFSRNGVVDPALLQCLVQFNVPSVEFNGLFG